MPGWNMSMMNLSEGPIGYKLPGPPIVIVMVSSWPFTTKSSGTLSQVSDRKAQNIK
jgi:hypothetical protein